MDTENSSFPVKNNFRAIFLSSSPLLFMASKIVPCSSDTGIDSFFEEENEVAPFLLFRFELLELIMSFKYNFLL